MSLLGIILIIIIVFMLLGAWPSMPYWGPGYANYGYWPSSLIGIILLIVILLLLFGRI